MRWSWIICTALVLWPACALAGLGDLAGEWRNQDANTRGITHLTIGVNGDRVTVHAWGSCHPQDCDWGQVDAVAYGPSVSSNLQNSAQSVVASFQTSFSRSLLVLDAAGATTLRGQLLTRFTDASQRTNYTETFTFVRDAANFREDCVSFNPATTTVARVSGHWKVVDGNHWLFDFNTDQRAARRTLAVIQHYHMNQSCFVGRPDPSFSYMTVAGAAPTGAMAGEDCVGFNPASATVRRINGTWKIVDGNHWLFDFGVKKTEADRALAIIKRYGFTKSCFVARPNPPFTYMRK